MKRKVRTRGKARTLVITPLGYRVLRLVAAGKYKFAPTRGIPKRRRDKGRKA